MPPLENSRSELKYKRNLSPQENWPHEKQLNDGAEGLWRIHDRLYDLSDFVEKHPGGAQWLKITQGTDCTETFESHHLTGRAETVLSKYFVKDATSPRNSPYTFHPKGFYKAVKARVSEKLETLPKETIKRKSEIITDSLALVTLALAVLAAYWDSHRTAALSGTFLAFLATSSHNFIHQRDNWRMYYFHLGLMSVRHFRISHILSHHPFANTLKDMDILSTQPYFNYLPDPKKNLVVRYLSWFYWPFIHDMLFLSQSIQRFIYNKCTKLDAIGLIIPVLMLIAYKGALFSSLLMWAWLILFHGFIFGLIDIISAHHHPELFHEGDLPREDRDWGLAQIDATRDRQEFFGFLPLILITLGDHSLHHLFPAVDHSLLRYLYPVVEETCKDYGFEFKTTSTLDLLVGQYQQLARNKPNTIPPRKRSFFSSFSSLNNMQRF